MGCDAHAGEHAAFASQEKEKVDATVAIEVAPPRTVMFRGSGHLELFCWGGTRRGEGGALHLRARARPRDSRDAEGYCAREGGGEREEMEAARRHFFVFVVCC
jgi:hypothetical protein